MSAFDNNITNPSPGLYVVTNGTGADDTLKIVKIIGNTVDTYEYEDVSEVAVLDTESYNLTVPDATMYVIYWVSDDTDTATIINTVSIDVCILKLTNSLLCCETCYDCEALCSDMRQVKNFISLAMLYEVFQDLIEIHFGSPQVWYSFTTETVNERYTLYDVLNKMNLFCSCSKC